jgi:outer membrane protein
MKFKLIIVFIFSVVISTNAQEADVWNLEKCINYAHENNIRLKIQELSSTTNQNNFNQAKYNFLPTLNGFATHEVSWGKTFSNDQLAYVDQNYVDGYFGVDSRLTLFDGLQNIYTLKQNKYSYLSSKEEVEKVKNDISLELALAYLQVLYNTELLEVSKDQYDITTLQEERTTKMVEAGSLAKGSLLEITAQKAGEKVNVTNSQNSLDLSYISLIQLLDLETLANFQIEVPTDLEINLNENIRLLDSVYDNAVTNMPQIKSAEYNVKSNEIAYKMTKMQALPDLSLRGLFYTRYSEIAVHPSNYDNDPNNNIDDYSYGDQIKDFAYRRFELNLNFPLFNNLNQHTAIQNSKVNYLSSQYQLEQAKQTLYKTIQQAQADAIASLEEYKSNQEAEKSMEESFRYTQQRFDVGMVNSVDYNIAKNNLTKAQSELIRAKYNYIFRTKILDFYMGIPITL